MADSRRSRAVTTAPVEKGVSVVYTALAALVALAGLAWALVYIFVAFDGTQLRWMYDLRSWNWLIGFGVMFLGLMLLASRRSPLGRGRGVVWGMLGCFLVGLAWIVLYYMTAQEASVPVIRELGNYNLLVGIGFMATGFVYATKWE